MYEIKKGIAIPQTRDGRSEMTRTLAALEPGDCFDIPERDGELVKIRSNLAVRAKRLKIRLVTRSVANGAGKALRVWRSQ